MILVIPELRASAGGQRAILHANSEDISDLVNSRGETKGVIGRIVVIHLTLSADIY